MEYTINADAVIKKAMNIVSGNIEDCMYHYNPNVAGGVLVVDKKTNELIELCNNGAKFIDIANKFKSLIEDLEGSIRILSDKGILSVDTFPVVRKKKTMHRLQCWFHITNNCNLACDYCYVTKSKESMQMDTAYTAIDKMLASCREHRIKDLGLRFSGGEPTTRMRMIKELTDYTRAECGEVTPHFSIITNGTMIDTALAEYLHRQRFVVAVSLDGVKAMHDLHRHDAEGNGSFERVMRGIEMLMQHRVMPEILVTITPENLNGLPQLTEMLCSMRVPFRFSLERNIEHPRDGLVRRQKELVDVLNVCITQMQKEIVNGNFEFVFQFADVHFTEPVNRCCKAGTSFFAIGHDGSLGVCGMGLRNSFGTIDAIDDVISELPRLNPELNELNIDNVTKCKNCTWKYHCAGGCPLLTKATYGTMRRETPYCETYSSIVPKVLHLHALRMYYAYKYSRR